MTENQATDYAAIVRAATQTVPSPPDWLTVGQNIYSTQQGIGEVIALLGKRLIIKFLEETGPTQLADWPMAVEDGQILPRNMSLPPAIRLQEVGGESRRISSEQIQAIPDLTFRALAHELSSTCTTIAITNGQAGKLRNRSGGDQKNVQYEITRNQYENQSRLDLYRIIVSSQKCYTGLQIVF